MTEMTAPTTYKKARKRGLNKLSFLRNLLIDAKRAWYRRFWRMDIHPTVQFSLSAKFDRTFPIGVHVGPHCYIAFRSRLLTHDHPLGL